MYKVMLVDDDYPVIELLSEAIEWGNLGVMLQSTHENGAAAFEKALYEMPDILITDIGMPKMNGIELTKMLKELNPQLQIVILSCHSEFEFAKQALRLQVQDYLVKDMFDPEDLCQVIKRIVDNLEKQKKKDVKQVQLQHLLDKNKNSMRERFIKKTINQASVDEKEWLNEAESLGLQLDRIAYTASMAIIHDYNLEKERYLSEDTLTFAIQNIVSDIIKDSKTEAVFFSFGAKEILLCFPNLHKLKKGSFDEKKECIQKIQKALKNYFNINISFMMGKSFSSFTELRNELILLQSAKHQRFYMAPGTINKREVVQPENDDLFSKYDEAASEFRELMVVKDESMITPIVTKWITFIEEKKFHPELVKEWMLKLLLDFKVKLQALQLFRSEYIVEGLHNKIILSNNLSELKVLLIDFFKSLLKRSQAAYSQTKRSEILDAIGYVSRNLEKRISLEEVSSYLFLNQSYFSRLFKKEVGENFVEFVTKMKITRAKELLEQTPDSVGKICERLGYDNQSYFIKLFKTHVGVTPIEFRGGKASAG
ncbi:response regulator [Neobacillus sp. YX16]|uniref:response regulator transcription factor n=1 Tax=Neobacillus sp. YX16 TaxID=3047874 RepID=UPI0024C3824F|nr:response regulator [Neobacillus sp. YX16]WHZ03668.1 response regulator [Neobacillus sp. YX16]